MKHLATQQGMGLSEALTLSVPDQIDVKFTVGDRESILSPPQVREVIATLTAHLEHIHKKYGVPLVDSGNRSEAADRLIEYFGM